MKSGFWIRAAAALSLLVLALGCGGKSNDTNMAAAGTVNGCTAGQSLACACPDGHASTTTCLGGVFGPCACGASAGSNGVNSGAASPGTGGFGTGGTLGSGGALGSGGTTGTGGMLGSGGMTGTGGMLGSGGMTGTGGMTGAAGAGTSADDYTALRQVCVDTINMYRQMVGAPPLARATATQEMCSDTGAKKDGDSGVAHGSAGSCPGFFGQDTCPGWMVGGFSGNATLQDALKGCLAQMWGEGMPPVSRSQCEMDYTGCFLKYGHYLNMSDPSYTTVSCGFYKMSNGAYWMNQDFK